MKTIVGGIGKDICSGVATSVDHSKNECFLKLEEYLGVHHSHKINYEAHVDRLIGEMRIQGTAMAGVANCGLKVEGQLESLVKRAENAVQSMESHLSKFKKYDEKVDGLFNKLKAIATSCDRIANFCGGQNFRLLISAIESGAVVIRDSQTNSAPAVPQTIPLPLSKADTQAPSGAESSSGLSGSVLV